MNKIKPVIKVNLKISLMICHIRCTMNKPITNSKIAGKNFQVKAIAIKIIKYDIFVVVFNLTIQR
jgi:hypothetical protein